MATRALRTSNPNPVRAASEPRASEPYQPFIGGSMPLLERIGTLLRANINDLIEKAEDPEKLARQLVLDMENQLIQIKTQVAMAMADQHLLLKRKKEHEDAVEEWHRKAELAVTRQRDDLARAALERSLKHEQLAKGFAEQFEDQQVETEMLRSTFLRLQQKLGETEAKVELLLAQHRRARTSGKANVIQAAMQSSSKSSGLKRLRLDVQREQAKTMAGRALIESESLEDSFDALEKEEQVERLLEDLKNRQPRLA
jgi:phage shock protein A